MLPSMMRFSGGVAMVAGFAPRDNLLRRDFVL